MSVSISLEHPVLLRENRKGDEKPSSITFSTVNVFLKLTVFLKLCLSIAYSSFFQANIIEKGTSTSFSIQLYLQKIVQDLLFIQMDLVRLFPIRIHFSNYILATHLSFNYENVYGLNFTPWHIMSYLAN